VTFLVREIGKEAGTGSEGGWQREKITVGERDGERDRVRQRKRERGEIRYYRVAAIGRH